MKRNLKNIKRRIVITRVKEDGSKEQIVKEKGVFQVDRDTEGVYDEFFAKDQMLSEQPGQPTTGYFDKVPSRALILLLLMVDKVISYRSTLLYEPLIACLCSQHPGVRSLSVKNFQKIHIQIRSKHPSLL